MANIALIVDNILSDSGVPITYSTSGTSGTSGANGAAGSSGTSGANGAAGSSGTSGTKGTSGTSGANGAAGSSGTSGTKGTSGTAGTSGSSGSSGAGTISGTINTIPKFTAATTIGNSAITDNGTTVTLVSRALSGTSATLSSSLTIGSTFNITTEAWLQFLGNNVLVADGDFTILQTSGTGLMRFRNNSAQNLLTLANNGAATFSSSVTAGDIFSTDGTRINFFGVGTGANVGYVGMTTNHALAFLTNNTEKMRITSGGNVGIGTSSPNYLLHVNSSTTAAVIQLSNSTTGSTITDGGRLFMSGLNMTLNNREAGFITFETTDTERMRITSGGHVGIKVVPNSGWGSVMSALQIGTGGVLSNWTGGNNNFAVGVNYYDNGAGSVLRLYSGGVSKIEYSEDTILFANAGSNSAGTSISFTERMRITSGGNVLIGTTSDNTHKLQVNGLIYGTGRMLLGTTSSSSQVEINGGSDTYGGGNGHLKVTSSSTGQTVLNISNSGVPRSWEFAVGGTASGIGSGVFYIYDNTASAARMVITTGGNILVGTTSDGGYKLYVSGTIYATGDITASSDARYKTNIRPIENALEKIVSSRGVVYDRVDEESFDNVGFIAQELEVYFPELVSTDNKGYKGVKYQNAVAVLFEGIKEQQKQIEELKTLIDGFTK